MTTESVVIPPYDPRWSALCEEERQRIESAISSYVLEIRHIGGTAVPGLAAKSLLDIT